MSSHTTNPPIELREVWVWEDGCDVVAVDIQPKTKRIEDLKRLVLGESRKFYRASHLGNILAVNVAIPTDVSFEAPIRLMRITNHSRKYCSCCTRK